MNIYAIKTIEKDIERLEQVKRDFPNKDEEFMYEPDLSQLKRELEVMKNV